MGSYELIIIGPGSGAANLVGPLGFNSAEGVAVGTGPFQSGFALANSLEAAVPGDEKDPRRTGDGGLS